MDHDLITDPKFNEQRETFKRISNIKQGGTDTKAPKTMSLVKKLSENKAKKGQDYQMREHLKHVASM